MRSRGCVLRGGAAMMWQVFMIACVLAGPVGWVVAAVVFIVTGLIAAGRSL